MEVIHEPRRLDNRVPLRVYYRNLDSTESENIYVVYASKTFAIRTYTQLAVIRGVYANAADVPVLQALNDINC